MRLFISLFLLLHLPGTPAWAVRPSIPSRPPAHVVDLANIIEQADEERLERLLTALERATTVQMAILTLESLDGEPIETVSLRTAESWRLGQQGKDNGFLFTVALEDRKYRFETGYGLESILPDSLLGSLGRQFLVPRFRQGRYSTGILVTTQAIVRQISEQSGVTIPENSDAPKLRQRSDGYIPLVMIAIFFLLIFLQRQRRRGGPPGGGMILFPGPWTSGGGFDGGFGGFGGGGGGFGGGGASGDW